MIGWLLGTRLGRFLAAAGAVALAIGAALLTGRSQGRRGALTDVKAKDAAQGNEIRRRVAVTKENHDEIIDSISDDTLDERLRELRGRLDR